MRRAFTLIEILVVVSIIAMLMTVGIQQVLRARITGNEQVALSDLWLTAQSCHFFSLVRGRYPTAVSELTTPASDPPYLTDPSLLSGQKTGYQFAYTPEPAGNPSAFTLTANPVIHGVTGVRHFVADQTLAIHATSEDRDATSADPVVR